MRSRELEKKLIQEKKIDTEIKKQRKREGDIHRDGKEKVVVKGKREGEERY